MRAQPLFTNFSWGEMSPIMQGRVDLVQVQSSCQILENFFVDPHGGVRRRLGSRFVYPTKYPTLDSRLIPFIFSREDSYILEFGNYYIRFYRGGGILEDPGPLRLYLGDGSSDAYWFPFTIPDGNIEVYLNPDPTSPVPENPSTYSIILNDTDPVTGNLIPALNTWDNPAAGGYSPWTGVTATAMTAPAGRLPGDTCGIETQLNVGMGSSLDVSSQITAATFDLTNNLKSDPTVQLLPGVGTPDKIIEHQLPENGGNPITVDASFEAVDLSGNRTFNFAWRLLHGDTVLDSGSDTGTGLGVTITSSGNVIDTYNVGDTISIEVTVLSTSHQQSTPATDLRSIDLTNIYVNPNAQWHAFILDARGGIIHQSDNPIEVDPVPVSERFVDDVTAPAPWSVLITCDYGASITIEDIRLWNAEDGKYIVFNTAPAVNDIIVIREVDGGGSGTAEVFELQTPYSASEVLDIQFVQANDVMTLVHERHHPRELRRYNTYDWRLEQPDYTDGKEADADYVVPEWAKSTYDPSLGYPRTVQYFQQRLIFAGTASEPQTVWGSRVADFNNFAAPSVTGNLTLAPDDAVSLVIAAQTQEEIQWIAASRALFIGTTGNEHRVTVNSFLAVDNLPDVTRQSQYGSRNIQPEFIGTAVLFVQRAGKAIRTYDLDRNANVEFYDSLNVAWLSEHITGPGVINMSFWREPFSVLWCTRSDGVLAGMTYDPSVVDIEEDLLPVGWARQLTSGKFKWVANLPTGQCDQTWMIVEREVGVGVGGPRIERYVEFMCPEQPVYMDSAIDGGLVNEGNRQWSGAEHLAERWVQVLANGAVHPDVYVDIDGKFELTVDATFVQIGLEYTSKMKTAKFEGGVSQSGTDQSAMIGWNEIVARLDVSALPKINGQQPPVRHPATPMGVAEPLSTGDTEIRNLGLDKEGSITIETSKPYPCHILAIFGNMGANSG